MRSLAVCVLFVVTTPATASSLLIELTYSNAPNPAIVPGTYSWQAARPSDQIPDTERGFNWSELVLDNTFRVDEAPPALLALINRELTTGYQVETKMFNATVTDPNCTGYGCALEVLLGSNGTSWSPTPVQLGGWLSFAHVHKKGVALEGYTIDRAERTITPLAQTIRLYGVAVPEPATPVLIAATKAVVRTAVHFVRDVITHLRRSSRSCT